MCLRVHVCLLVLLCCCRAGFDVGRMTSTETPYLCSKNSRAACVQVLGEDAHDSQHGQTPVLELLHTHSVGSLRILRHELERIPAQIAGDHARALALAEPEPI